MADGRYSKIFRRMWNDEKFRALSAPQPCGQWLWIRFLSGTELGPVPGLFAARESGLADVLKWSLKSFRESFSELSQLGLAKADWEAGLVWIRHAIRYNEPANPNVVASWEDAWAELPECQLKSEAYSMLCDHLKSRGQSFVESFTSRCRNYSSNHCPNQEHDQDQDQEPPKAPQGGRKSKSLRSGSEAFGKFWESYPRKVGKGQALRAWPGDDLLPEILAALEWQKPTWRDPKFVKHPSTWLNGRCWEDEKPAGAQAPFFASPRVAGSVVPARRPSRPIVKTSTPEEEAERRRRYAEEAKAETNEVIADVVKRAEPPRVKLVREDGSPLEMPEAIAGG